MKKVGIKIRQAEKKDAQEIARLIMMAMTDECCLYYCADGCCLNAFRKMMTYLVNREDSQYSYRNTLVAMDGEKVVGISVSYDGGMLHTMPPFSLTVAARSSLARSSLILTVPMGICRRVAISS